MIGIGQAIPLKLSSVFAIIPPYAIAPDNHLIGPLPEMFSENADFLLKHHNE
jgi:hypothetical protein